MPAKWYQIRALVDNTASVDIFGPIGASLFEEGIDFDNLLADLARLADRSTVRVNINSPGGSYLGGIAIYNRLRTLGPRIETFVLGLAGSIASIIMLAGDRRVVLEGARVAIHEPSGAVGGTAEEITRVAKQTESIRKDMVSIYSSRTNMREEQAARLMKDVTTFDQRQAFDLGFTTECDDNPEKNASIYTQACWPQWSEVLAMWSQENEGEPMADDKKGELEITAEYLLNAHPDIVKELTKDAVTAAIQDVHKELIKDTTTAEIENINIENKIASARIEAKQGEMERIKAIYELSIPGHEETITAMMWDGSVTPEQAAIKLIREEKAKGLTVQASLRADEETLASLRADLSGHGQSAKSDVGKAWDKLTQEERDGYMAFEDFKCEFEYEHAN